MASLLKRPTGLYAVQFYDPYRKPARKWVSTSVRDARSAERTRRRWEVAYAEGRYDPWCQPPPDAAGEHGVPVVRSVVTLAETRRRFLGSRSHLALNTRANYERVTGWFVDHVGGDRSVVSLTSDDISRWLKDLDVKPVTKANYARHLREWFRYCMDQGWIG